MIPNCYRNMDIKVSIQNIISIALVLLCLFFFSLYLNEKNKISEATINLSKEKIKMYNDTIISNNKKIDSLQLTIDILNANIVKSNALIKQAIRERDNQRKKYYEILSNLNNLTSDEHYEFITNYLHKR